MLRRCHRSGVSTRQPAGAWLAFLAIAVQILLPFLVAYEIGLAGRPADAATISICHTPAATAPEQGSGSPTHHGLGDGCPICVALAAGQAFTAAAPVVLPVPQATVLTLPLDMQVLGAAAFAGASYNPRAPPTIA